MPRSAPLVAVARVVVVVVAVCAGVAAAANAAAVMVDGLASPLVFFRAEGALSAQARADQAATLWAGAAAQRGVDVDGARVDVDADHATVRIYGKAVATLGLADAQAAGAPTVAVYAEQLQTALVPFVASLEERSSLKALLFHVFLSVTLVLVGVLTLRGARRAFARVDASVDERALPPLSVLGVTVLSADAVRGLLTSMLGVVRVVAYLSVVVVTAVAVFAQFPSTRAIVVDVAAAAGVPVVEGLARALASLPGVVLAGVLLLAWRGFALFARAWLDGVAAGRVQANSVEPRQVAVVRVAVAVGGAAVVLPLAVAAAFGRFGTPLEHLALGFGAAVLVALVPLLSSAAVGALFVWRGALVVGEWVQLGSGADAVVGEIVRVGLSDVVLVPARGGTVTVAALSLLWRPLMRLPQAPRGTVVLRCARDRGVDVVKAAIVAAVGEGVDVRVVGVDAAAVVVEVAAKDVDAAVRAVAVAVEAGAVVLV
jgi:hypothetical protein